MLHACFFKRYPFRLDVYHSGVFVECLADSNGVGTSRSRALHNRMWGHFLVCGEDRADQAIGFSGAWVANRVDRTGCCLRWCGRNRFFESP